MKSKIKFVLPLLMALLFINTGCNQEDPPLPDNILSFSVSEVGFDSDETSKTITLSTSRAVVEATQVTITVTEDGVTYGEHYTTEPAMVNGKVTLTIPAKAMEATLTVKKVSNVFLEGTESLQFAVERASSEVVIDKSKTTTLKFEAILSEGDMMTIQGKLDAEEKVVEPVYIDFSQNQQQRMAEMPYTLGFYCGDDFRVLLNNTDRVKATFAGKTYETAKTDINAVTLADADDAINIGADGMMVTLDMNAIDDASGKLEGTVFRKVSDKPAENKVYLVAIGKGMAATPKNEWYKVKVNRKDNGYSVQYALIDAKEVKTIDIEKKEGYNLVALNLETGKTFVREPEAAKWDILYSPGMAVSTSTMGGGPATPKPYFMQDLIFINNLAGVQAAEVSTEDIKENDKVVVKGIAYEDFSNAHLKDVKFSSDRSIIGINWRNVFVGVNKNVFYVVKDAAGNVYKLRFLKMGVGGDGGVRGRPEMEYALVK